MSNSSLEQDKDKQIISFSHYCTCGGYAHTMNGRDEADPHMHWCPQKEEYKAYMESISETKH